MRLKKLEMKGAPGSYQRLDLFIKVLRVLCPNVTAASRIMMTAQTLAWRRKGAQGLFLVTAMFLGVNLLSREGYSQAGDRMKAFGMITTKKK